MKKTKLALTILFILGLFLSKSEAQNYSGNYSGEWSSLDGDFWTFKLHIEKDNNFCVWSHIHPPTVPEIVSGTEYLKYTAGNTAKTFRLTGYKKEDPHNILLLGDYFLKVSENGKIIYGSMKSPTDGKFDGSRMYGLKD
jgi:hypothetical protein